MNCSTSLSHDEIDLHGKLLNQNIGFLVNNDGNYRSFKLSIEAFQCTLLLTLLKRASIVRRRRMAKHLLFSMDLLESTMGQLWSRCSQISWCRISRIRSLLCNNLLVNGAIVEEEMLPLLTPQWVARCLCTKLCYSALVKETNNNMKTK